jgi:hypothetical protein
MGVCAIFWFEIDGNMKNDGLFYLYSGYWILDIGYWICDMCIIAAQEVAGSLPWTHSVINH